VGKTQQLERMTPLEYARSKGKTLGWVYTLCRLGKIPATLRGGRWEIRISQESRSQKDSVAA